MRSGGGGAQIGKRRLMSSECGVTVLCDSILYSSFRAVVSVVVALSLKIATASTSREISLVSDYEDVTTR